LWPSLRAASRSSQRRWISAYLDDRWFERDFANDSGYRL
jgi:hypothetical protein